MHHAHLVHAAKLRLARWLRLLAQWSRVAVCEEGGWIGYAGATYPDSLGIDAGAWYGNGGGSDLSPRAQIRVAVHLIDSLVGASIQGVTVYVGFVPDQGACSAW